MVKLLKQFTLVGIILLVSGGSLYLRATQDGDYTASELEQYRIAQQKNKEAMDERQHKIEQGVFLPTEEGKGHVFYNEETGQNIITTTDNEIIVE